MQITVLAAATIRVTTQDVVIHVVDATPATNLKHVAILLIAKYADAYPARPIVNKPIAIAVVVAKLVAYHARPIVEFALRYLVQPVTQYNDQFATHAATMIVVDAILAIAPAELLAVLDCSHVYAKRFYLYFA